MKNEESRLSLSWPTPLSPISPSPFAWRARRCAWPRALRFQIRISTRGRCGTSLARSGQPPRSAPSIGVRRARGSRARHTAVCAHIDACDAQTAWREAPGQRSESFGRRRARHEASSANTFPASAQRRHFLRAGHDDTPSARASAGNATESASTPSDALPSHFVSTGGWRMVRVLAGR